MVFCHVTCVCLWRSMLYCPRPSVRRRGEGVSAEASGREGSRRPSSTRAETSSATHPRPLRHLTTSHESSRWELSVPRLSPSPGQRRRSRGSSLGAGGRAGGPGPASVPPRARCERPAPGTRAAIDGLRVHDEGRRGLREDLGPRPAAGFISSATVPGRWSPLLTGKAGWNLRACPRGRTGRGGSESPLQGGPPESPPQAWQPTESRRRPRGWPPRVRAPRVSATLSRLRCRMPLHTARQQVNRGRGYSVSAALTSPRATRDAPRAPRRGGRRQGWAGARAAASSERAGRDGRQATPLADPVRKHPDRPAL